MSHIWIDPKEVNVPNQLKKSIGGHPLVAETLVRRGISDLGTARSFLDPDYYKPTPASELPGIDKAVMRINQAIDAHEMILVWGDFDVDGQTSTTLLVEALQELGATVTYHIPIRATEGHGIQVDVLKQIVSEIPDIGLLLTCDTGIAAVEAVEFANDKGLDVLITDHHDLPETLPLAHAIIDPKLLPNEHPLATLPGVGVAYKLVEALFESRLSTTDHDRSTEKYLDLVALGIVADVADQRADARYLLQHGLNVLRNTQRLGLQTLMELAQIIPNQLDESTIGFGIGPRLNALGRLSDANPIVEFLTSDDPSRTRILATQLEGLNERRKLLTEQITQATLAQIEQDRTLTDQAALVLAHSGWHTGVIGIVASRLVERFGKPAILLSIGKDGIARGSARSIKGVHITEAITTQKELLIGFGGHPGAAGLSLPEENIAQFRRGLGRAVRNQLGELHTEPTIQIDAYLPLVNISLDLVDEIKQLAPFGAGNPSLTLASKNLHLVSHTPIGRGKEHLRLVVEDEEGNHQNILWWNGVGFPLPEEDTHFDLAFTIQDSSFRGERQLQIQWIDFRPIAEAIPNTREERQSVEIIDLRGETNPLAALKSIQAKQEVQVWAEGAAETTVGGLDRNELQSGACLAIWHSPPGPKEWEAVLEQVQPQQIYLFSIDPKIDDLQSFLGRLAGLVKYALGAKDGLINLASVAGATGQRSETIKTGLLWMKAKGYIQIIQQDDVDFYLAKGSGEEIQDVGSLADKLNSMLTETSAYRSYFQTSHDYLT